MRVAADAILGEHYRLERQIGEGGMGMVWSAVDERTGERVAVKVLKDGTSDPILLRRFFREARAAMAVSHPNVVRIREVAGSERAPVIVMDFLVGESLASRLERVHKLGLRELAPLFVDVVSAIGTAHAAGIVHRDLKPDNIFIVGEDDGTESPRVVDFGIAKLTALDGDAKQSGGLTTTGAVLGTPYYMSPEQVFGDKFIDHRSDVWSLGLIAFECLAGYRAVEGENIGQILKMITTGAVPKLRNAAPSLPEDVLEIVDRMISFDRTKRPSDLREVLNVFKRHTTRDAQDFGEATLPAVPRDSVESAPIVSPVADTLPALSKASSDERGKEGASTTSGAAMDAAEPPSPESVAVPSRSRLYFAVAAALVLVGGAGAYRAFLVPEPQSGAQLTDPSTTQLPASAPAAAPPTPKSADAPLPAPTVVARAAADAGVALATKPPAVARPAAKPKDATKPASAPSTASAPAAAPVGAPLGTTNPYE